MKKYLYFIKYLKKGKFHFFVAVICGIAFGATSGLALPVIFEKVFKKVFEAQGTGASFSLWYILMLGGILPGVFLVRGVLSFLNGYFMSFTSMILMKEMRWDIFRRVQLMPMSFFDKNSHGDLVARMVMDPLMVQNATIQLASEIIKQPAQMFAAFCTLVYVCVQNNSYLMIPLFALSVAIAALPIRAVKHALRSKGLDLQNMSGGIMQQISENLDAAVEIRSFNLEDKEIKKHDTHLELMKTMGMKLIKYQRMQQPVVEFFSATVVSAVFIYAHYVHMPFSAFMALGLALYMATDPLKRLANLFADLHIAEGAMDRIRYILDMPLCITDPENPISVDRYRGTIKFNHVTFEYADDVPVLHNINVTIPAGKKVALVGHSGAGKSTFAKLISRFYDVKSGEISIDGIAIKDVLLEDLRRNISVVSQYPVLFHDTIYNNISIGCPDATEESIRQAAKNAYAHDFIESLPNGYQTNVGERGDLISGGQKQRIAIARAFLKSSPILILDEATSSLDSESEHFIQKALEKLTLNKTVITIAHRLSTIKDADIILVFEKGHIIASGTHRELFNANAIYRNFVEKQSLRINEFDEAKVAEVVAV